MTSANHVVVVGAGVIGCSVTYSLVKRGIAVTLIDKSYPGRASSASAGGLWPVGESIGLGCGVIYHKSERGSADTLDDADGPEPLPRHFLNFLVASNKLFPALSEELREISGIDIESESGTGLLYLMYSDKEERHARWLLEQISDLGRVARLTTAEEARELEPRLTPEVRGAVYFAGENQVNPMNLTEALKRASCSQGATFLGETAVTGLQLRGEKIVAVETSNGRIECDALVNAAGAWSAQLARMSGIDNLPVYPVRGQIVCTEALQKTLRCNLSTSDCYLLQKAHGEVLIGSTTERCDFDAGVEFEKLRGLAAGARRAVPALRHATLKRTWAGLRPGTPDELPVLGPVPQVENYFNATGGFRTGIVAAPLTGEVVAAQVAGEEPDFPSEPFLMARFAEEKHSGVGRGETPQTIASSGNYEA